MNSTSTSASRAPDGAPPGASDRSWATRFIGRHRARRSRLAAAVDALAWVVGVSLATLVRYEGDPPARAVYGMFSLGVLCAVVVVALGMMSGLHRGRFVVGSFDEITAVGTNFLWAAATLVVANSSTQPRPIPLSAALAAGPLALVLALAPRYAIRRSRYRARSHELADVQRAIVFGAGEAGQDIVRMLLRERNAAMLPVAVLDDDPMKANRVIEGVKVMGDRTMIPLLARALRADCLLVAIPSAQPGVKQELAQICEACDLSMRILPPVSELVNGLQGVHQIREVTEEDLLGRPQVEIDAVAISGDLRDRVVLVTGAGGSIGSEICRQVAAFAPRALIMLDRDESALHGVQLSLEGRALLDDPNLVVADIRDRARIHEVFATRRPDVVFHAAALKHLPLLEMHPAEGIKTNVWGTQHLLDAALEFETSCFVNISTDKAADPVSVLGRTKLLAERLTAAAARRSGRRFVSVRFGNVLGSRGSVLPTFRAQIRAGGPVTVTHAEATRYFMTTAEAARLVLQAAAVGAPGEVLVLDMGEPVRIDDVARRLIARSGRDIRITYTGLRPGEKLHEQLVSRREIAVSRSHPLVLHAVVEPVEPAELAMLDASNLAYCAVMVAPAQTAQSA